MQDYKIDITGDDFNSEIEKLLKIYNLSVITNNFYFVPSAGSPDSFTRKTKTSKSSVVGGYGTVVGFDSAINIFPLKLWYNSTNNTIVEYGKDSFELTSDINLLSIPYVIISCSNYNNPSCDARCIISQTSDGSIIYNKKIIDEIDADGNVVILCPDVGCLVSVSMTNEDSPAIAEYGSLTDINGTRLKKLKPSDTTISFSTSIDNWSNSILHLYLDMGVITDLLSVNYSVDNGNIWVSPDWNGKIVRASSEPLYITIVPWSGWIPPQSITVNGHSEPGTYSDITYEYDFDNSYGIIILTKANENVSISAECRRAS